MDIKNVDEAFRKLFENQQDINRGSLYANLKDGRNKIRFVSQPYPERQHYMKDLDDDKCKFFVCEGRRTCPICAQGFKAGFEYRIVGVDRTDFDVQTKTHNGDVPVKFFSIPSGVVKNIEAYVNEDGISVTERDFVINKSGKGLKTEYTVMSVANNIPLTEQEMKAIEAFPEPETLLKKPMSYDELSTKILEDPHTNERYVGRNAKEKEEEKAQTATNNFAGSENKSFDSDDWDNFS
jgi:hypothetical protein